MTSCYVYILESKENPRHSYIGYTVNMERRIRQHNGDLKTGGAKRTRAHRPWHIAAMITADPVWFDKIAAQQLEWALKFYSKKCLINKRAKPFQFHSHPKISERLNGLWFLFNSKKQWTRSSPMFTDQKMTIHLANPFQSIGTTAKFSTSRFWKPSVQLFDPELLERSVL